MHFNLNNSVEQKITKNNKEALNEVLRKTEASLALSVFLHPSSIANLILQYLSHPRSEYWVPPTPATGHNQAAQWCSSFGIQLLNSKKLTLEKSLYNGTQSHVYKGKYTHRFQSTEVVIKRYISIDEMLSEARIMTVLQSDNLMKLKGVIILESNLKSIFPEPEYSLVMEYMPGGDLSSLLLSNQHIDWTMRYRLALDVARGLCHLHELYILHRDVKSQNVVLDAKNNAILIDFGTTIYSSEASKAKLAGTAGWLAPEVLERRPATKAADIYSLGMLFWQMASRGNPPFDTKPIIPNETPEKFKTLIEDCLNTIPKKRPTAAVVVASLMTIVPLSQSSQNLMPAPKPGIRLTDPIQGNVTQCHI